MIMADILAIALSIIGFLVTLAACWVVAGALFPRFTERAAQAYGRRPIGSGFIGLAVGTPVVVIGVVLANNGAPFLKIFGLVIVALPLLAGLAGSAGLARRVGEGLGAGTGAGGLVKGSAALSLTFLIPLLGWFVLLPWVIASGLGAWVMARKAVAIPVSNILAPAQVATVASAPTSPSAT